MSVNENVLARAVALREGGKKQVSVGQVKQVLKIALDILATHKPSEVLALLEKHG